jgi:hypothetical protein
MRGRGKGVLGNGFKIWRRCGKVADKSCEQGLE